MGTESPSVQRYQYSGCAYCYTSSYGVKRHMFKYCYEEHCIEVKNVVLREEERSSLAQTHEQDSEGEDGDVAEIGDELERGGRSEVAMEGERIAPDFSFFYKVWSRVDEKKWRT